jgi:hypothetical protein
MRSGSIPPHLELAAWNGGSRPKLTPWQKFRSLSGSSPPIASLTSALQRLSVALAQSARGFPAFASQPKLYCIYWALDGVKVLVGSECQIARTVGRHCSNLFCQLGDWHGDCARRGARECSGSVGCPVLRHVSQRCHRQPLTLTIELLDLSHCSVNRYAGHF